MKKTAVVALIPVLIPALPAPAAAAPFWDVYNPRDKGGIEIAGDYLQIAIPLSGFIYSAIIGDWRGTGQLGLSFGATWATTEILKKTIREERPDAPEGSHGDTFPSGHTSAAFAGAGYWQRRYGWAVGTPMYAAATFVAYSRVQAHAHNWLDVATGAAIGIGFNYLFTSRYVPAGTEISVAPTDGGAMFRFSTQF